MFRVPARTGARVCCAAVAAPVSLGCLVLQSLFWGLFCVQLKDLLLG